MDVGHLDDGRVHDGQQAHRRHDTSCRIHAQDGNGNASAWSFSYAGTPRRWAQTERRVRPHLRRHGLAPGRTAGAATTTASSVTAPTMWPHAARPRGRRHQPDGERRRVRRRGPVRVRGHNSGRQGLLLGRNATASCATAPPRPTPDACPIDVSSSPLTTRTSARSPSAPHLCRTGARGLLLGRPQRGPSATGRRSPRPTAVSTSAGLSRATSRRSPAPRTPAPSPPTPRVLLGHELVRPARRDETTTGRYQDPGRATPRTSSPSGTPNVSTVAQAGARASRRRQPSTACSGTKQPRPAQQRPDHRAPGADRCGHLDRGHRGRTHRSAPVLTKTCAAASGTRSPAGCECAGPAGRRDDDGSRIFPVNPHVDPVARTAGG